jgi:hypothetical protein
VTQHVEHAPPVCGVDPRHRVERGGRIWPGRMVLGGEQVEEWRVPVDAVALVTGGLLDDPRRHQLGQADHRSSSGCRLAARCAQLTVSGGTLVGGPVWAHCRWSTAHPVGRSGVFGGPGRVGRVCPVRFQFVERPGGSGWWRGALTPHAGVARRRLPMWLSPRSPVLRRGFHHHRVERHVKPRWSGSPSW